MRKYISIFLFLTSVDGFALPSTVLDCLINNSPDGLLLSPFIRTEAASEVSMVPDLIVNSKLILNGLDEVFSARNVSSIVKESSRAAYLDHLNRLIRRVAAQPGPCRKYLDDQNPLVRPAKISLSGLRQEVLIELLDILDRGAAIQLKQNGPQVLLMMKRPEGRDAKVLSNGQSADDAIHTFIIQSLPREMFKVHKAGSVCPSK